MREAYRLQKPALAEKSSDGALSVFVFFIYTSPEVPSFQLLFEKMKNALSRLEKAVLQYGHTE